MKKNIYALNTPETEIQFELMLIANGRLNDFLKLIQNGWGIYPQVLNAIIASNGINLRDILTAAGKHGNYNAEEMKIWMENYYGLNWKKMVTEFKLDAIAAKFFTGKEIFSTNLPQLAALKLHNSPWDILAKAEGIDSVKNTYLKMRKELTPDAHATEKKLLTDIEQYLCWRYEYEFLYKLQCWRGLSNTLDGVKYIAETKHYINGIAECLLSYFDQMPQDVKEYCISTLDSASLDDNYRPRYLEWKSKH